MGFNDILKNSFVQSATESMSIGNAVLALGITCLIAIYIFFIYRVMTRKAFYSKSFNVSLVALSLITAAIILSIQSSVVISLGMVGALSIVRFRTAVKEPMDLVFLFWSISVGIICGAGLFVIAFFASLLITAAVLALQYVPTAKESMLLIVDSSNIDGEEEIMETVEKYSAHSKVKSRNMDANSLNMVIEGMRHVSMVSQEGEATF